MSPRQHLWLLVASMLVVVGIASSLFGAQLVAHSAAQRSHQAFLTTSTAIAGTLDLALQHEQDLAVSEASYLAANPDGTEAQFTRWLGSIQAFSRYPELQGIVEISYVPASQLAAFEARKTADPAETAPGAFRLVPPGRHSFYCFDSVSEFTKGIALFPPGFDYCDTPVKSSMLTARASGRGGYLPYHAGKITSLVFGAPFYKGGSVPPTTAGRQAAFLGIAGTQIRPSVILAAALRGHAKSAVAFHYQGALSNVTFYAGTRPAGTPQTAMIDLHNGWQVRVFGSVSGGELVHNGYALVLLACGSLLSLLFGVLIYVLGTSRRRALQLVTDRTEQLRHQAFHDLLTGLPNRALLLDRMDRMLARARRDCTPLAVLFLDLDNFKEVNDTLGHEAGDHLLVAVAQRLTSVLREDDTLARLGGDEFVILAAEDSLARAAGKGGTNDLDGAQGVAARVLEALASPFDIVGSEDPVAVTASIGIATGYLSTPDELLRDSDRALYRAKASGKQQAVRYLTPIAQDSGPPRRLEVDLLTGHPNSQFSVQYQPIVDLETNALNGVEARLFWRHPDRGVVRPEELVPALESAGLMVTTGQWLLRTACQQGAAWQRRGHRLPISINISADQLKSDDLADNVRAALVTSGFDPGMLILAFSEAVLLQDLESNIARIESLKSVGLPIAMDKVGTGHASLVSLRALSVDILKIDRSLVARVVEFPSSTGLVRTLAMLAGVLGLETVAEGVESEDQRLALRSAGLGDGQGVFFGEDLDVPGVDLLLPSTTGADRVLLLDSASAR